MQCLRFPPRRNEDFADEARELTVSTASLLTSGGCSRSKMRGSFTSGCVVFPCARASTSDRHLRRS